MSKPKSVFFSFILICITFLSINNAKALVATNKDSLTTKYFAGFVAEQKMNDALNEFLKQKNFESKDSIQLNRSLQISKIALDSLKSAKKQVADFKTETNNYNNKYFEVLKSQNNAMIQVSKKITSTATSNIKKIKKQRATNKEIRKSNNKSVDGFLSGLHYYATKYSANSKPEDTINILHKIDLMNDSAKIYTSEYLNQTQQFNTTYDTLMQRADTYQKLTDKGISILKKINAIRKNNSSDSDFTLANLKKNWQITQSSINQLLFLKTNFLLDTLFNQFRRIQQNHFKVIAIEKKILKQNKKLRRCKQESQSLIQGYLDVSNSMQTFLYRHNDLVRLYSSKCNHLKKELKNIIAASQHENEELNKEITIAKKNKSIRSKALATITSIESKILNQHIANCLKHIKLVESAKQKIK